MKPLTLIAILTLLAVQEPLPAAGATKPLKVFILAGQSNMEGHAAISTFDYIGKDPLTAPILKEMRNPDGTPRVCDKVWMSYLTGPYEGLGKLTAGFGERGNQPTITPTRSVDIVGSYKPLKSGFNYKEIGVVPKPVSAYK